MELNNNQIGIIGYFTSSGVIFITLQDIVMAFMLGFVGAAGAWLFKWLVDYCKKFSK